MRLAVSTVRFVERDPESTWVSSWLPEREAPLASLQSIKVRNRGRGALHGLAIGAGTGAVIGAAGGAIVYGVVSSQVEGSHGGAGFAVGVAALGAVAGAVGIGLVGAGIGAIVGAPTTVEFSDAPAR